MINRVKTALTKHSEGARSTPGSGQANSVTTELCEWVSESGSLICQMWEYWCDNTFTLVGLPGEWWIWKYFNVTGSA